MTIASYSTILTLLALGAVANCQSLFLSNGQVITLDDSKGLRIALQNLDPTETESPIPVQTVPELKAQLQALPQIQFETAGQLDLSIGPELNLRELAIENTREAKILLPSDVTEPQPRTRPQYVFVPCSDELVRSLCTDNSAQLEDLPQLQKLNPRLWISRDSPSQAPWYLVLIPTVPPKQYLTRDSLLINQPESQSFDAASQSIDSLIQSLQALVQSQSESQSQNLAVKSSDQSQEAQLQSESNDIYLDTINQSLQDLLQSESQSEDHKSQSESQNITVDTLAQSREALLQSQLESQSQNQTAQSSETLSQSQLQSQSENKTIDSSAQSLDLKSQSQLESQSQNNTVDSSAQSLDLKSQSQLESQSQNNTVDSSAQALDIKSQLESQSQNNTVDSSAQALDIKSQLESQSQNKTVDNLAQSLDINSQSQLQSQSQNKTLDSSAQSLGIQSQFESQSQNKTVDILAESLDTKSQSQVQSQSQNLAVNSSAQAQAAQSQSQSQSQNLALNIALHVDAPKSGSQSQSQSQSQNKTLDSSAQSQSQLQSQSQNKTVESLAKSREAESQSQLQSQSQNKTVESLAQSSDTKSQSQVQSQSQNLAVNSSAQAQAAQSQSQSQTQNLALNIALHLDAPKSASQSQSQSQSQNLTGALAQNQAQEQSQKESQAKLMERLQQRTGGAVSPLELINPESQSPPVQHVHYLRDSPPEFFSVSDIEDDSRLTTLALIEKYGYPSETRYAYTDDGYQLSLHRIPRPGAPPVLLVHGLMASSASWVQFGPSNGLAYILYRKGYDVWMLNTRGNLYSREHKIKRLKPRRYWDFSFHEIGVYDLPSSIDLILELTGQPKVHYIGHSQGSTIFFVMCSERPEYAAKVSLMQALAPTVYMQDNRSPVLKFLGMFKGKFSMLLNLLGGYEISAETKLIKQFRQHICSTSELASRICAIFDFVLCGFDWKNFNQTLTPIVAAHASQGASAKQIYHYAQLQGDLNFQHFDHGRLLNRIRYKSNTPPQYNLSQAYSKVVLHHGGGDWLGSDADVGHLQQNLPNLVESRKVNFDGFAHFDFTISKDVRPLVYDSVLGHLASDHYH